MHVIGVTGMPGSGKSEAVQVAREQGVPVVRMGDLIWEEVDRQGLPRDAANVGRVAGAMRKERGDDVWALRTVDRIQALADQEGAATVVIDGVRSMVEVETFRRRLGSDFHLVAVDTPAELRYPRMMARGRDDDPVDVSVLEERDRREESWGIRDVIAAADTHIPNLGDIPSFRRRFASLLE